MNLTPLSSLAKRRQTLQWLATSGMSLGAWPSLAQNAWPSQPIRFVVPFVPGGTSDIVARTVAQELAKILGVPVVIDNKAGGGGVPAMQDVARAAPDGDTVILGHGGSIAVNPLIYPDSGYDVNRDFAPFTQHCQPLCQ